VKGKHPLGMGVVPLPQNGSSTDITIIELGTSSETSCTQGVARIVAIDFSLTEMNRLALRARSRNGDTRPDAPRICRHRKWKYNNFGSGMILLLIPTIVSNVLRT